MQFKHTKRQDEILLNWCLAGGLVEYTSAICLFVYVSWTLTCSVFLIKQLYLRDFWQILFHLFYNQSKSCKGKLMWELRASFQVGYTVLAVFLSGTWILTAFYLSPQLSSVKDKRWGGSKTWFGVFWPTDLLSSSF